MWSFDNNSLNAHQAHTMSSQQTPYYDPPSSPPPPTDEQQFDGPHEFDVAQPPPFIDQNGLEFDYRTPTSFDSSNHLNSYPWEVDPASAGAAYQAQNTEAMCTQDGHFGQPAYPPFDSSVAPGVPQWSPSFDHGNAAAQFPQPGSDYDAMMLSHDFGMMDFPESFAQWVPRPEEEMHNRESDAAAGAPLSDMPPRGRAKTDNQWTRTSVSLSPTLQYGADLVRSSQTKSKGSSESSGSATSSTATSSTATPSTPTSGKKKTPRSDKELTELEKRELGLARNRLGT